MNAIFTLGDVLAPVKRALRLTADEDLLLARQRIDVHHRELCALADWPALRAETSMVTAGAALAVADAAGISAVFEEDDGAPFWFCERWDVAATDLQGRRLWSLASPSRDNDGQLLADVWEWDEDAEKHGLSTGENVIVCYWKRPGPLAQDLDRLALPSTRALTVRAILDLVGLMDRKDVDVAPWRAELEPSLAELKALNPGAQPQALRLASGRILTRGPLRV